MKYLSVLVLMILFGCGGKGKSVMVKRAFPRVVYNSCSDEYAVMTDSSKYEGASFFGKAAPERQPHNTFQYDLFISGSDRWSTYDGPAPPPPPPSLIVVNSLHDTLKFTKLGGEFQFKDSAVALKSYLSFYKECKDSEDILNAPIKIKIKAYWDSASIRHRADSIANRGVFVEDSTNRAKAHIEDSIFKCQHTYQ